MIHDSKFKATKQDTELKKFTLRIKLNAVHGTDKERRVMEIF